VSLFALNKSFDLEYCLTNCLQSLLSDFTHLTPLNEHDESDEHFVPDDELEEQDELDELGHDELVVLLV
jgi:hypothetical protein